MPASACMHACLSDQFRSLPGFSLPLELCPFVCQHVSFCRPDFRSVCLSVCLTPCQSVGLFVCVRLPGSDCLSIWLPAGVTERVAKPLTPNLVFLSFGVFDYVFVFSLLVLFITCFFPIPPGTFLPFLCLLSSLNSCLITYYCKIIARSCYSLLLCWLRNIN